MSAAAVETDDELLTVPQHAARLTGLDHTVQHVPEIRAELAGGDDPVLHDAHGLILPHPRRVCIPGRGVSAPAETGVSSGVQTSEEQLRWVDRGGRP